MQLKPFADAAWAQAYLSAIAILVSAAFAIGVPLWQRHRENRAYRIKAVTLAQMVWMHMHMLAIRYGFPVERLLTHGEAYNESIEIHLPTLLAAMQGFPHERLPPDAMRAFLRLLSTAEKVVLLEERIEIATAASQEDRALADLNLLGSSYLFIEQRFEELTAAIPYGLSIDFTSVSFRLSQAGLRGRRALRHMRARLAAAGLLPLPTPPAVVEHVGAVAYERRLTRAGWRRVGSGVGGRVYRFPRADVVLKVSEGDAAYLAFAEHARAHPGPCMPRLRILSRQSDWALVEIEALEPLDEATAAEVATWSATWSAARRNGAAAPEPRLWSAEADALIDVAKASGSSGLDLKPDNFMLRGTQVVFTDPLAP